MPTLPATSETHYLTGMAALSIPTEDGDFADWHFDATFLREGARLRVAGVNFPSTETMLGTFGIRECSEIMRKRAANLEANTPFYAANYTRAVLDLLLTTTEKHERPDFINAADVLPSESLDEVMQRLAQITPTLTNEKQRCLIESWIAQEQQKQSADNSPREPRTQSIATPNS